MVRISVTVRWLLILQLGLRVTARLRLTRACAWLAARELQVGIADNRRVQRRQNREAHRLGFSVPWKGLEPKVPA